MACYTSDVVAWNSSTASLTSRRYGRSLNARTMKTIQIPSPTSGDLASTAVAAGRGQCGAAAAAAARDSFDSAASVKAAKAAKAPNARPAADA